MKLRFLFESISFLSKFNYESIDGSEDFSGHVSLKVGKSVYFINFLSGDKTAAREEAFDENGMVYGKYTFNNADKQSKVVVSLGSSEPSLDQCSHFSPESLIQ